MSKEQHTPGPWRHEGPMIFADSLCVASAALMPVPGGFSLTGESMANAALIAAAPDLLDALESALFASKGDWNNGHAWDKKARAAIAKARGES